MSNPDDEVEDTSAADVEDVTKPKRRQGFAAMDPETLCQLSSRGGKTAHARGTANEFTSASGSAAGKLSQTKGTAYRWTPEDASRAGKLGAEKRKAMRAAAAAASQKSVVADVDSNKGDT